MHSENQKIIVTGGFARTASLEEEWYEDVKEPETLINQLKGSKVRADLFTFWQRLPKTEPEFDYYLEWDSVAALPVKTVDYWLQRQIYPNCRRAVKKSEKEGIVVRESEFNDDFVRGMVDIFNEAPVRQGKPFWHYGKDFENVKREFSKYVYREFVVGAYYNNHLIGFLMFADTGNYATITQIISKLEYRDKSPNYALLAKAVEMCEKKGIPFLVYAKWSRGGLGDFKRRTGFEKVDLPRYYIPLTTRGAIALRLHLHHGITGVLPEKLILRLIDLRKKWHSRKNA